MENKVKILVIGAGTAGLSALKALKKIEPQDKYSIVCIQKQSDWSGQWNLTMQTTVDQYGQPIHSGMYSQLWTNTPKQCFEFSDYTLKEHFGKSVPSYLPREIFKGYFMARFEKQGLKRFIKFDHAVKNVKYIPENKQFKVLYKNLKENSEIYDTFDYVIVANGHYSQPYIPQFKEIHSHDIRQFKQFQGKNVLVVGGFLSAEDMALQCLKFGANHITWTYRTLKMPYSQQKFPKNMQLIEGLSHVDQNHVYFMNGQKRQIDCIILGTGYRHSYPFLEQQMRLSAPKNIMWPQGLYKGMVWRKNHQLLYIGMGNYEMCQTTFDVQGYLAKGIIQGKIKIPDLTQKDPADLKRQQMYLQAKSFQQILGSICNYIEQLMQITDCPKYDPRIFTPLFMQTIKIRVENLVQYRDTGIFKSAFTGQQSCLGNKKWIQMKQVQPTDKNGQKNLAEFFQF